MRLGRLTCTLGISEGNARITVFASSANARTFDYQAGDIGKTTGRIETVKWITYIDYRICSPFVRTLCREHRKHNTQIPRDLQFGHV